MPLLCLGISNRTTLIYFNSLLSILFELKELYLFGIVVNKSTWISLFDKSLIFETIEKLRKDPAERSGG